MGKALGGQAVRKKKVPLFLPGKTADWSLES